jgi:hypothetical protein
MPTLDISWGHHDLDDCIVQCLNVGRVHRHVFLQASDDSLELRLVNDRLGVQPIRQRLRLYRELIS